MIIPQFAPCGFHIISGLVVHKGQKNIIHSVPFESCGQIQEKDA